MLTTTGGRGRHPGEGIFPVHHAGVVGLGVPIGYGPVLLGERWLPVPLGLGVVGGDRSLRLWGLT